MPDDAAFCSKCGTPVSNSAASQPKSNEPQKTVIAPQGATSIKCPNCGAPIVSEVRGDGHNLRVLW